VVADSTAVCAVHSAPAIGPCERCGTFVCDQCRYPGIQRVRCLKCGPPEVEKAPGTPVMALLLGAVGLMCPPLSLVGIAVALLWRYSERRGPSLGVQYARWAVVVSLMSLIMGGALYYWTGRMVWAVAQDVEKTKKTTGHDPAKP
jgi:hypothetical protein